MSDRREFLKLAATAAATTGLAPDVALASGARSGRGGRRVPAAVLPQDAPPPLGNGEHPAYAFQAWPGGTGALLEELWSDAPGPPFSRSVPDVLPWAGAVPTREEDVAFLPVHRLAALIREGHLTPTQLTEIYLERLTRYDPELLFAVTILEGRAREEAQQAEADLRSEGWKGPLHGIPYGLKDLFSVGGAPTTWGSEDFRDQVLDEDAEVARRLRDAGAILVAKLATGEFARGDRWYRGRTLNPWNPEQGSSGSSAGPASATAAGCVAFGIGTETQGSIVSPARRCGLSALRPTFGRVSRAGAMALSWTMDKLGPICRSAEDCALVLHAIHGSDGRDPTARDVAFDWDADRPLAELRVGYPPRAFEGDDERDDEEWARFDREMLERIRELGVDPIPVEIPDDLPMGAMRLILTAEAGAAFDELTRSGRDDLLVRQNRGAWPNTFRKARLIPAVEYIQANRLRTMAMERFATAMEGIDVLVTPSFDALLLTNLTGHPQVVIPNGYRSENGTPTSFSFVGALYADAAALRLAKAVQDVTDFHQRVPAAFA